jgi:arylsulfatase A-like enzyme
MRWPGNLPAGKRYSYRVSTLDVLPTCLAAAGIPVVASPKLDGQSFLDAAKTGSPSPTEGRPLFWHYRNQWAVLEGDWKLVRSSSPGGTRAHQVLYDGDPADPGPALFNLSRDTAEQHDVSRDNHAIFERLNRMFEQWSREMRIEATRQ